MTSTYGHIFEHIVFPLVQKYRGQRALELAHEMEQTQWLTPDQIRDMQWAKTKATLDHAYKHIPLYRQKYAKAGVHPEDIRTWDDFERVPLLSKDELKASPHAILADDWSGKISEVRTSGTSGQPLSYYWSPEGQSASTAAALRGRGWFDIQLSDPYVLAWGYYRCFDPTWAGRFYTRTKSIQDAVMNRRWLCAYDMSESDMWRYYKLFVTYRPTWVLGYGSPFLRLSEFLLSHDLDLSHLEMKGVVLTSDMCTPKQRETIEHAFGCPTISEYGAVETGIIGYECPEGSLHTMDENMYVEIVPREGLPKGLGEIVCTHLSNPSSPLIRYKTTDIGSLSSEVCSCGRGLSVLDKLEGRVLDFLITEEGKYVHWVFFMHLFDQMCNVKRFQAIQLAYGHFRILIQKEVPDQSIDESFIVNKVREHFGNEVIVDIEYVSDIPLEPSGKLRYVKCQVLTR